MNQSGNNAYYKYGRSCPEDFVRHMIEDLGLTPDQRRLCLSIIRYRGNDQFHADRLNVPEGSVRYNFPILKDRQLAELFRLAIVGFEEEKKNAEKLQTNRAEFLEDLARNIA